MPRPELTEEQRREIRRRIRQSAADLYAESGLENISARAIAKQAGVSVGTIYSHFGSLPELMQSLWRQPVRRLVKELGEIAESDAEPMARLRRLLEKYVAFARDERAVYRGAFMFVRPDSHAKPDALPVEQSAIPAMMIAVLESGQASGAVRDGDPVEMAQMLWAGVHGALSLPENLDRVAFESPDKLAPAMIDILLEWVAV